MDGELVLLSNYYKESRGSSGKASEAVLNLYQYYLKKHSAVLMDSVSAATAIYGIFMADQIDFSKITPQMEEAFELAYPNVELSSLVSLSPNQIEGYLAAWKGKYFEVLVRDQLNAGEWVGDIQLEPGQVATLAESATQPGWDLQILNADGTIANELQLKATDSLSYIKKALERYPDIQVLTTDEIATPDELADKILPSGFSDASLEEMIAAPMAPLFDSTIENLFENILPGLPFIIIAVSETHKVMVGRKIFQVALGSILERAVKTGISIGVGSIVYLLDGGILSLPATVLTRLGIDRYQLLCRAEMNVQESTEQIQVLLPYYR